MYVALEGHSGIDNRIYAAAREIGTVDAPFKLIKIAADFRNPEAAKSVAETAVQLMRTFGDQYGACPFIAVDTYTAALGPGASDCDPRDVSAFIANIEAHLLTQCTVMLAHHFGKDASRGGRGWSGLRAALDFELEIDQDDKLRIMRLTKNCNGSDRQPAFCYRFHGRELGKDQDGDPVTAVIVEHLADEDAAGRDKRISPKARAALNILWEMIKNRTLSFPIPERPDLRCVLLADWEKACIAPGAITEAKAERDRRAKFRLSKLELEEASEIACDGKNGERVYPTPKPGATACDDFGL